MPGARYVDIYNTINHGRYSDELKIDGRRVLARQADGVRFSRDGAVRARSPYLRAMAKDYRACGEMRRALGSRRRGWRWAVVPLSAQAGGAPPAGGRGLARGGDEAVHAARSCAAGGCRQSTSVSRHALQGADVMRRYGDWLPHVIHVSLGHKRRFRATWTASAPAIRAVS